ncbi:MAG: hypothetical protein HYR55_11965 [Acidobacteria bacterium]|nr:hypothetical protein [Acidobacteriota bacterium]MBI3657531.1 hypothetical protein [Acidobacteriota bacterium]
MKPAWLVFMIWLAGVPTAWSSNDVGQSEPNATNTNSDQGAPASSTTAWHWTFKLRNRSGFRLARPRVWQMSRYMADVKGTGRLNDRWRLTLEGRAHYDPIGRLGFPKILWVDPRQVLLDGRMGPLTLSLGLQQVVWGQADGLRILDVVNPLDYREFILEDFPDSRRPLWMARVDAPFIKQSSLQFLWIPYFAPGRVPAPENEFGFGAAYGLGVFPLALDNSPWPIVGIRNELIRRPPHRLRASQAGLRWSRSLWSWDLTAHVFHGWEDIATPDLKIGPASYRAETGLVTVDSMLIGPVTIPRSNIYGPSLSYLADSPVALRARRGSGEEVAGLLAQIGGHYDRKTVFGVTAANTIGPVVLRLEAGWTARRPFAVRTFPVTAPFQRFGQFAGVLGIDYSFRSWLWTSAQYFLQLTSAPQSILRQPRNAHLVSLHLRGEFQRETLHPEVFILAGLSRRQFLLRPRVARGFGDHWSAAWGVDIFGGHADTFLGFFATRKRAVVEIKYER